MSPAPEADDPVVDRWLRELTGESTPLPPPPYGFEYVVLKARTRRRRRALLTATVSALAGAVAATAVVTAGLRPGASVITTAGCDTMPSAPAVWTGTGLSGVASSGFGFGGEVMDRRLEWAIGGVLTAAALAGGIVAGCAANTVSKPTPGTGPAGLPASQPGTASPQAAGSGSTAAVAAGGSPSSSPSPSPSSTPRCHTADLSPAVSLVAGSGGAGHALLNVKVTNTSGHPCTVYGFPGMKLEDQNQNGQATTVTRDHAVAAKLITLADGAAAATTVRFDATVPAADEPQTGDCEAPSAYLQITPPDETTQLEGPIGGGPITVCQHGALDVLAFVPGATGANQ